MSLCPVFGRGREESPDSAERCTFEREDVREGIGTEKKMTAAVCLAKPVFAKAMAGKGEKVG